MDYKKVYEFLKYLYEEKFNYPCDNCGYWECKKNLLNKENIIRKKYKWNDINWRLCLKNEKNKCDELINLMRSFEFKNWSHKKCDICGSKFFEFDLKIHIETKDIGNGFHEAEIVHLCKKCNLSYVHRKKALNEGYARI